MINLSHPEISDSAKERLITFAGEKLTSQERESLAEFVYDFVGADQDASFYFFHSHLDALEQLFLAIFLEETVGRGKNHFITARIHEPKVLKLLHKFEEFGVKIDFVSFDSEGKINLDELEELICPKTALITLPSSHPFFGTLLPLNEICTISKKRKAALHIDTSSTLGKVELSMRDLGINYLTFSGVSIHGPYASAALFSENDLLYLTPREEDAALLAAFSTACKQSHHYFEQMGFEIVRLRDIFEQEITKELKDVEILSNGNDRIPSESVVYFPHIHAGFLIERLRIKNICVSSPLQSESFIASEKLYSTLRFSFSRYLTEAQIKEAARIISDEAKLLRKISEGVFHE